MAMECRVGQIGCQLGGPERGMSTKQRVIHLTARCAWAAALWLIMWFLMDIPPQDDAHWFEFIAVWLLACFLLVPRMRR
jgi:hypothetical protein